MSRDVRFLEEDGVLVREGKVPVFRFVGFLSPWDIKGNVRVWDKKVAKGWRPLVLLLF